MTLDRVAAEEWISAHVEPVGVIETTHERPWATVLRVPITDGVVWFKACAPVQAFEPRLSAKLFARWPHRRRRGARPRRGAGVASARRRRPADRRLRQPRVLPIDPDELGRLRARLRDGYLEPWGPGLEEVFALALRVGRFAHLIRLDAPTRPPVRRGRGPISTSTSRISCAAQPPKRWNSRKNPPFRVDRWGSVV